MIIAIIIILVATIVLLTIYNMSIYKKIDAFSNLNQKVASLNILQEFMNTISTETAADEKIKRINEILIEKYDIKYSTIVVYNGEEYIIKASNVDRKHWNNLKNLSQEEIFRDSIETATPKYITTETENERLPYQKMEFGRAKSAMFFPLYIDNIYIGYWLIESGVPHDFDKIDTTILEVVKNNVISAIETISKQQIIENIVREDQYTGLKSEAYLYAEGKRKIDQFETSAICMINLINIEEINENLGRHTGNLVIKRVAEMIRQSIASEYVCVRYTGAKFIIAFTGVDIDGVDSFITEIKKNIESMEIEQVEEEVYEDEEAEIVKPKVNIAVTNYYKGIALEGCAKKLEKYINSCSKQENQINYI